MMEMVEQDVQHPPLKHIFGHASHVAHSRNGCQSHVIAIHPNNVYVQLTNGQLQFFYIHC